MAETLSGYSLFDELPTDWVKSDLLETISQVLEHQGSGHPYRLGQIGFVGNQLSDLIDYKGRYPTDWVKSDLLETP